MQLLPEVPFYIFSVNGYPAGEHPTRCWVWRQCSIFDVSHIVFEYYFLNERGEISTNKMKKGRNVLKLKVCKATLCKAQICLSQVEVLVQNDLRKYLSRPISLMKIPRQTKNTYDPDFRSFKNWFMNSFESPYEKSRPDQKTI